MRRHKSPLLTRHNKHSAFIALLCSEHLFPVGIVFNHHCTVFVVHHPNFRFEIRVSVISSSDNSVVVFVFSCFVRLSSNESGFCSCENCRFDQSVPFFVAEIAFQPDIKHPTLKPWQRIRGFSRPIHTTQHNDLIIKSFGGDKPGLRFYHRQDDSYIKILSPLQKNIMNLSPLQENFIMNLSLPTGGFFFYPQR